MQFVISLLDRGITAVFSFWADVCSTIVSPLLRGLFAYLQTVALPSASSAIAQLIIAYVQGYIGRRAGCLH